MARADDGHIKGGAEGGIGGFSEDCGWEDELDEVLRAHFEGIGGGLCDGEVIKRKEDTIMKDRRAEICFG